MIEVRNRRGYKTSAAHISFSTSNARHGLLAVLGPLELDVLNVLWANPMTSMWMKDIITHITHAKMSSVQTTLNRLTEKGLVDRRGTRADGFSYVPTMTKREFCAHVLTIVTEGMVAFAQAEGVPLGVHCD